MELRFKKNSLAIIIPMYNEEKIASRCIDEVFKEIKEIKRNVILMVVNDGSTDKTQNILDSKNKIYKEKLFILTNKKNQGYGGALKAGIKKAIELKYEYYLTMDSDLTNPPKYIHDFIRTMDKNFDCVKASRYIKGAKVINVPNFRRVISIVGNFMASLFFNVGIKDCTNGFKMVRLELLKNVHFKENNFSIILEEMYYLKKKRAKFHEIPNILYARKDSRSHFKYKPKIFYDYFKYLVRSVFI